MQKMVLNSHNFQFMIKAPYSQHLSKINLYFIHDIVQHIIIFRFDKIYIYDGSMCKILASLAVSLLFALQHTVLSSTTRKMFYRKCRLHYCRFGIIWFVAAVEFANV
jgi:hypothetical protein